MKDADLAAERRGKRKPRSKRGRRGRLAERECAREDDAGDDERDERVAVHAPAVVGQPDEQARPDHPDVAQRVSEHVQEHAPHVHRPVRRSWTRPVEIIISVMRVGAIVAVAVLGRRLFVRV